MHGDGEADDGFPVDRNYATAIASLFVARKFDAAFDTELIQLALNGFDKWFRLGELLDCHDSRVERWCGFERARNGKAQANVVTADVEPSSRKAQHITIVFRWNSQMQTCAALGKSY